MTAGTIVTSLGMVSRSRATHCTSVASCSSREQPQTWSEPRVLQMGKCPEGMWGLPEAVARALGSPVQQGPPHIGLALSCEGRSAPGGLHSPAVASWGYVTHESIYSFNPFLVSPILEIFLLAKPPPPFLRITEAGDLCPHVFSESPSWLLRLERWETRELWSLP